MKIRLTAVVAGCLVALAGAAPSAASTTIGSNLLSRANVSIACGVPGEPNSFCTVSQTSMPDRATVSPIDGVIVRWRIRSASGGTVRLRVIRPAGGGQFEGVAKSEAGQMSSPTSPGEDQVYTFSTRLPVTQGEFIGLDRQRRAGAIYHGRSGADSYGLIQFDTPLANGEQRAPDSESHGNELLLNADVEQDQDGDGYGDESQDNCPSIANDQTTNPCPSETVGGSDDPGSDEGPRVFRRHKHKRHHRPKRRGKRHSGDKLHHHHRRHH